MDGTSEVPLDCSGGLSYPCPRTALRPRLATSATIPEQAWPDSAWWRGCSAALRLPGCRCGVDAAALRPAGAGACVPGALAGLGLQPPPRRSDAAHQGFYWGTQIAQLRRQRLPSPARRPGWRPLIRSFVGSVGRLTRSARRRRCSRGHLRRARLLHAASRMEPSPAEEDRRGARGGIGTPGAGCAAAAGAQAARRRAERPAPDAQDSQFYQSGPASPISENLPGVKEYRLQTLPYDRKGSFCLLAHN